MYLPRRVGTPLEPFDPAVVIDRANRIYDMATMSSGCTQPMIAENELNGANHAHALDARRTRSTGATF